MSRIKITQRRLGDENIKLLHPKIPEYCQLIVNHVSFSSPEVETEFISMLLQKKPSLLDFTNVQLDLKHLECLLHVSTGIVFRGIPITDFLCSQFNPSTNILFFSIQDSLITSASIKHLSFPYLETLDLSFNNLSLEGEKWTFPNLKRLILKAVQIQNLKGISHLDLVELNLEGNELDDEKISVLYSRSYKHLHLENNQLTNTSLFHFAKSDIEHVYLHGNRDINDQGVLEIKEVFIRNLEHTSLHVQETSVSADYLKWMEDVNHVHQKQTIRTLLSCREEWKTLPCEVLIEAGKFI